MLSIDVSAGGTFGSAGGRTGMLSGARLVAGAGAARLTIREGTVSGRILIDLKAAAALSDECFPPRPVSYSGNLFVVVTGTPDSAMAYQG